MKIIDMEIGKAKDLSDQESSGDDQIIAKAEGDGL